MDGWKDGWMDGWMSGFKAVGGGGGEGSGGGWSVLGLVRLDDEGEVRLG